VLEDIIVWYAASESIHASCPDLPPDAFVRRIEQETRNRTILTSRTKSL